MKRIGKPSMETLAVIFFIAGFAFMFIPVGFYWVDGLFKFESTLPETGPAPSPTSLVQTPAHLLPESVAIKVRREDHNLFVRTIKADALANGGWTKYPNSANCHGWNRGNRCGFKVYVPSSYLERIKPLMESPDTDPFHLQYQSWAKEVSTGPVQLAESEIVQVSFVVSSGEFYNPLFQRLTYLAFILGAVALCLFLTCYFVDDAAEGKRRATA